MKAITIPVPGDADALVLDDVPVPELGPTDVLVTVAAAGVNRADLMQRQGFYDPPPGASPYPGLEVSGTVAAVGEQVEGWAVGDEVCALLSGGGYAEQVAVPPGSCCRCRPGCRCATPRRCPRWSARSGPTSS